MPTFMLNTGWSDKMWILDYNTLLLCHETLAIFYFQNSDIKPVSDHTYIAYYSIQCRCTCLCEASRTFNSLPRSGNTPKWSLPTTLRPLTANVFAESPSVKMSVHCFEFRPPASLASSSLGIPRILLDLVFWHFLLSWLWKKQYWTTTLISQKFFSGSYSKKKCLVQYLCFELHPVHDVFNNTTLSHLPREIKMLVAWYNETFLRFDLSDNIIDIKAACALRTFEGTQCSEIDKFRVASIWLLLPRGKSKSPGATGGCYSTALYILYFLF